MSEMVERVARAICAKNATLDWREYRDEAKRAIAAMREPTNAMIEAGVEILEPSEHAVYGSDCYGSEAHGVWRAMIDAALTTP
jgi:hypothetical protein